MIDDMPVSSISGDTEVVGALISLLLSLHMRSLFPMTPQNPELLPLRGRLHYVKTIDEEPRGRDDHYHRSAKSTYPKRKSVRRSGATPITVRIFAGNVWIAASIERSRRATRAAACSGLIKNLFRALRAKSRVNRRLVPESGVDATGQSESFNSAT